MPYKIPKDHSWCSYCIAPEEYEITSPCPDHRGPDGKPVPYEGLDAYEPSEWVLSVVGNLYRGSSISRGGPATRVYRCFGYDPRHGFWMRTIDSPVQQWNISERAIGRTYHLIRDVASHAG